MSPQEMITMKLTQKMNILKGMSDNELEQLHNSCWAEAKASEKTTGENANKLRNAADLVAMVQTQRKYS